MNSAMYNPAQSQMPTTMYKEVQNYVYNPDEVIGTGQFSKVFKGNHRMTKEQVAIKVIDLKSITDPVFLTMIQNEISVLKLINPNPNLLKLIEVFNTVNNMYIITDFCNQGDLSHLLRQNRKLNEEDALRIFQQLLNGLQELKHKCIIHRDIKPANILFNNGVPKLADFGFSVSKHLQNEAQKQLELYNVGTPLYMAPETILHNMYSLKSDIWSLGVVLYEMIYGIVPFFSNSEPELVQRLKDHSQLKALPFPDNFLRVSPTTKQLLQGMLDFDMRQRWNVETCLQYLMPRRSTSPVRGTTVMTPYSTAQRMIQAPSTMARRNGNISADELKLTTHRDPYHSYQQTEHSNSFFSTRQTLKMQPAYQPQQISDKQTGLWQPPRNLTDKENALFMPEQCPQNFFSQPQRQPSRSHSPIGHGVMKPLLSGSKNQILPPNPSQSRIPISEPSKPRNYQNILHYLRFIERVLNLIDSDQLLKSRNQVTQLPQESSQNTYLCTKLKYSMLKYCVMKIGTYESNMMVQVPVEVAQLLEKYYSFLSQVDPTQLDADRRFYAYFNNHFEETDEFMEAFRYYIHRSLVFLNCSLDLQLTTQSSNDILPQSLQTSIILLDYMVTLLMLIKLTERWQNNWEGFGKESHIENISNIEVARNVSKQHYQRVSEKLKKMLI